MHENKKICAGCGRNRRLGKFGKQSRMSDGKNIYCRDCMRKYTKKYKNSIKGNHIQKISVKKYKFKNRNKIKELNKLYYMKNKDKILYNKKCRELTECVNIFDEKPKKQDEKKINKSSKIGKIIINPKRKKDGRILQ